MADDLEQRHMAAIASVARALGASLGLEDLVASVVEVAREATGAQYAALGVIDESGRRLARFVHEGMEPADADLIDHLPEGHGVLGELIEHPTTLRLDDIASHPAAVGFPAHHPSMVTFLGTPVRSGGRVFGNLYLTDKAGGFSAQDEDLVEVLAVQVGTAVDNAVLAMELQDLAVREERERISRDLHDTTIQTLFSLGMGLDAARAKAASDPAAVVRRLDAAIETIDDTIRDLRAMILRLRSHREGPEGLREGIIALAREHEAATGVRPLLRVGRRLELAVPPEMSTDVLHLVREALTNVARHAEATTVEVAVDVVDGELDLVVVDDGGGFDTRASSAGHGLVNIRERIGLHDGQLRLASTPGGGTSIQATLPLPGRASRS